SMQRKRGAGRSWPVVSESNIGQAIWTYRYLEEVGQRARAAAAKKALITDRALVHDVVAYLRDGKGRFARTSVQRLRKHGIPRHGAGRDVGIDRSSCCVINNINPACVSRRDPRHDRSARTLADLERAIESVAMVVRSGKPNHVFISAGIVHC